MQKLTLFDTNLQEQFIKNQLKINNTDKKIEKLIDEINFINLNITHLIGCKQKLFQQNAIIKILDIKYKANNYILKQKFLLWFNDIKEISKKIRKKEILIRLLNSKIKLNNFILQNYLLRWKNNIKAIIEECSKRKIATFIPQRYKISEARNNWKKLSISIQQKEINEIINNMKQFISTNYTLEKLLTILVNKYQITLIKKLKESFHLWYLKCLKLKEKEQIKENKELNKRLEEFEKLKNKDYVIKMLLSKDEEIKELKDSLSRYPFKLSKNEELLTLIISSFDQHINFPIICKNKDIFNTVINKLYRKFPKYRKIGMFYICNGNRINEYLTMEENKIKDGDIIVLNDNDN